MFQFRHGSQIDCTRLENTFHLLNFVVHTFKDTPGEQICKKIEHYGKIFSSECKKSKEIRCFAVAILAHGSEGMIYYFYPLLFQFVEVG